MTTDTELARDLERAIPHLPTAAVEARLTSGRRALRRRRAYAGATGLGALVLTGGTVLSVTGEADTTLVSPATTQASGAEEIPAWAEEYGNHGPAAIAPNGDLWVAPDAELLQSVADPLGTIEQPGPDITVSYAVEAEMDGRVTWGLHYRTTADDGGSIGRLEEPGEWTNDFDVWLDDATATLQGRPGLAERLVHFADGTSEQLVAGAQVQIVEQTPAIDLPPHLVDQERSAAAEVILGGETWFVLAEGPEVDGGPKSPASSDGQPWATAYDPEVVGAEDLEGFLDFLEAPAAPGEGDQ